MPDQIPNLLKKLEDLKDEPQYPKLPITGNDIMEIFKLNPSPKVGELLSKANELWFENPNVTKEEILNHLFLAL